MSASPIRLRASCIFREGALELYAVERVDCRHQRETDYCVFSASLDPVAVVVCGPDGAHAVDMDSRAADLDVLTGHLPDLAAAVARCRGGT